MIPFRICRWNRKWNISFHDQFYKKIMNTKATIQVAFLRVLCTNFIPQEDSRKDIETKHCCIGHCYGYNSTAITDGGSSIKPEQAVERVSGEGEVDK